MSIQTVPLVSSKRRRVVDWSMCAICQSKSNEKITSPGEKGIECVLNIAEIKQDELYSRLAQEKENLQSLNVKWHRSCYSRYTRRPKAPEGLKRGSPTRTGRDTIIATPPVTRLSSNHRATFDSAKCIICQRGRSHHSCDNRNKLIQVQTVSGASALLDAAQRRQDVVFLRLSGVDLVAAGVRYHNSCRTSYVNEKKIAHAKMEVDTDCIDRTWAEAFEQLVKELDPHLAAKSAVELSPICDRFCKILKRTGNAGACDNRRMKALLVQHYGDAITFQTGCQSQLVYSASVKLEDTVRQRQFSEKESLEAVIEADLDAAKRQTEGEFCSSSTLYGVAKAIRADMQQTIRHHSYSGSIDTEEAGKCVPDSLYRLLNLILTDVVDGSRESTEQKTNLAVLSIGQDMMYVASKNRFLTPKHAGLALATHQTTRSKAQVQLLHAANHCISYEQLLRLDTAMAKRQLDQFEEKGGIIPASLNPDQGFVRFAADNIDINEETLDGQGTFHATQMAAFQTQGGLSLGGKVPPSSRDRVLKHPMISNLHQTLEVRVPRHQKPACPTKASNTLLADCAEGQFHPVDLSWLVCRNAGAKSGKQFVPAWTAFNQRVSDIERPRTLVACMPILRTPAHEYDTLWTVMMRAKGVAGHLGQSDVVITFDQALYCKAKELCWLRPGETSDMVIMLGSFHTAMTFMRCIGQHFVDSGLKDAFVEGGLFTETSAEKIMQGKFWNRGIRAHKLAFEALWRCLPSVVDATKYSNGDVRALLESSRINVDDKDPVLSIHELFQDHVPEMLKVFHNFETQCSQDATTQFWLQYFRMVSTPLRFVRADREGNWTLHLATLAEMLPWFHVYDHVNYARWALEYLLEMVQLESTMPNAYHELAGGGFSVQESVHKFSSIGTDQAIEHVNAVGKAAGGMSGITRTDSALDRRSELSQDMFKMLGLSLDTTGWQHKESGTARLQRDEDDVVKLSKQFALYKVFQIPGSDLVSLSTRDLASQDIKADLLGAFERGRDLVTKFIDTRLADCAEKTFFDPIQKVRSKTFTDLYAIKAKSPDGKERVIKADRDLYRRLLAATQSGRNVDLQRLVKHELSPVPWSRARTDGSLNPSDKSSLMAILAGDRALTILPATDEPTCVIIDAMALVQSIGKPQGASTFGDLADIYIHSVKSHFKKGSRVDVVFDTYRPDSIKHSTRVKRAGQTARLIRKLVGSRSVPLPAQWQAYINMDANKMDLTNFLATELIRACEGLPEGQELVVAGGLENGEHVSSSSGRSVAHLWSNQEEADTRMVLHAADAAACQYKRAVVCSRDTDVLVILVHFADQLPGEIWMSVGTSKLPKHIPIHEVSKSLPVEICQNLVAFHALTGCDTTSQLSGHGKRLCWKAFCKSPDLLNSFGEDDLSPNLVSNVESFVCQVYYPLTAHSSVNGLRAELFLKKSPEKLPPTSDALFQHTRRAHYQTKVWRKSLSAAPILPQPTALGWEKDGEMLKPVLTTIEAVPAACVDMVMCKCKANCSSARCSCRKHKLPCTSACGCSKETCSNISDISDSDHDES